MAYHFNLTQEDFVKNKDLFQPTADKIIVSVQAMAST